MALENKKSFIPNVPNIKPLKKELAIAPEKAAKKLYTEEMFTISKLTERAKRSAREVDELTSIRLGDEQLHAFGTPSAAETAALNALTEKIQAKLKKAQEEVAAATEAYSKLDKDLLDLGLVADNPMRLNIAKKRELGNDLLEKLSERIQRESSLHEQDSRRQAVREALRPTEPMPLPKAKKEKTPVTETLVRPKGEASPAGETLTAGEINEFSKIYDEAARKDLEGVITPEEVAQRIQEATDRENPINLSEIAPGYTAEELAARKQKVTSSKLTPTTSGERLVNVARTTIPYEGDFTDTESATDAAEERAKEAARMAEVAPTYTKAELDEQAVKKAKEIQGKLTPTTSGERLVNVARSSKEFNGDFGPKTAEEFLAQQANNVKTESSEEKNSVETVSNVDFNKLALALEGISDRLKINSIRSVEELQQALNTPELVEGLNELIPAEQHGKNILEFTGKKIFGLFGKPQFNKAKASEYFLKLTNEAMERASKSIDTRPVTGKKNPELSEKIKTVSGESLVTVARAPGKKFTTDTDVQEEAAAWNEMIASAKKESGERFETSEIQKTVDSYINEGTPLFIRRTSGEMNSGGRAKLQTADGRVLVTWTDPETQIAASKYVKSSDLVSWQKEGAKAPATKNYEKPRTMYEAAGEYLTSVQDQLKSGQISTTAQLEAALNQMRDPSFRDLLSSQERFTTKISEAVSDKIPGFFGAKYKFNPDLAVAFVAKLNQNAAKTAETFHE